MLFLRSLSLLLKWTALAAGALMLLGILFEQYSRWRLEKNIRNGRTFVNINGHDIHYVKKGTGNCTVIFESGLASDHYNWVQVQQEVSKKAVTLSYDRSGMFLSEAGDTAKTNRSISNELSELLEKTNCPKPYIVVGHSMGAIYLRAFIDQHKQDIAGVVFVEAAHPQQMKRSSPEILKAFARPPYLGVKAMIETGIFRVLFSYHPVSEEIPMNHPFHTQFKKYFYKSYKAIYKEAENDSLNFEDAERYNSFGNIPLTVIMGNPAVWSGAIKDPKTRLDFEQLVDELHHDFLKLSSNSRLVNAEKSGHIVQVNDSDLIAREIGKVIDNN